MSADKPNEPKTPIILFEAIAAGCISRVVSSAGTDPGWLTGALISVALGVQLAVYFWGRILHSLSLGKQRVLQGTPLEIFTYVVAAAQLFVIPYNLHESWKSYSTGLLRELPTSQKQGIDEQAKEAPTLAPAAPSSAVKKMTRSPSVAEPGPKNEDRPPAPALTPVPAPTAAPKQAPEVTPKPAYPAKQLRDYTSASFEYLSDLCKNESYDSCRDATSPFIGKWLHVDSIFRFTLGYRKETGFSIVVGPENLSYSFKLQFSEENREYIVRVGKRGRVKADCEISEIGVVSTTLSHCEPKN